MNYLAITLKGLEAITAQELKGKILYEGHVMFSKLKEAKTANTILQLLDAFEFETVKDIEKHAAKLSIKFKKPFRAECAREGTHNFKSIEVEQEIGKILFKKGNTVDLKNPKEIFYVSILNNKCCFGIVKYDHLCKRIYRVKRNNQSISACLAHALLLLANIKKSDIVLDPFCKDAVIPIEAALYGIKKIYAFDALKNNIRNAEINMKMAKVKINLENFDVSWLDTKFKEKNIDYIITNIFIGRRDEEPEKIVKEFFYQAKFIVKKGIVLVTNKPELIKRYNEFTIEQEIPVTIGDMHYAIFKIKR